MNSDAHRGPSEAAVVRFAEGFNCSQAVLSAFAERFGVDQATALKIASGFGGGMGCLGHTCGAVTGALMVLGLKHGTTAAGPAAKEAVYARVRDFAQRFQALHRSLACRDLVGYDLSVAEDLQRARESGVFKTKCPAFVRDASAILEEML